MKQFTIPIPLSIVVMVVLVLAACEEGGATNHVKDPGTQDQEKQKSQSLEDAVIPKEIRSYLDEASLAASKFPLNPHIKNRSRMQHGVLRSALELDQALLADSIAGDIAGWEKAVGYADIAVWAAERGMMDVCRAYVARSMAKVEEDRQEEDSQSWRGDLARARASEAMLLIGDESEARRVGKNLEPAVAGGLAARTAALIKDQDVTEVAKELEAVLAKGSFDQVGVALNTCIAMHKRYLNDPSEAGRFAEMVRMGHKALPITKRIQCLMKLAENFLEAGKDTEALGVSDELLALIKEQKWRPEDGLMLEAQILGFRARAGDADVKAALEDVGAQFLEQRERIHNTNHAKPLRAIAEAYWQAGHEGEALNAYLDALRSGAVNPNARPRADDFIRTLCSLAVRGVRPNGILLAELKRIQKGLTAPW